jgi:hypothetical protein
VKYPFEQVLDTCLTQLHNGADLETVLSAHPEYADDLRPLLATLAWAHAEVPPPVRRDERKADFVASVAERRRLVESVDGYVVELKAGVPFDELVARAPAGLRPALFAARTMHETAPPRPSPEAFRAGKERLMALAAERQAARRAELARGSRLAAVRGLGQGLVAGLRPAPSARRRVWSGAAGAVLAVLVAAVGLAGVGTAAAESLPGEAFYQVKRLGESAQLLFAFDPRARADLNLRFSARRLDEIKGLADNGHQVPLALVEDWLRGQTNAWTDIQRLPLDQRQLLAEMFLASSGDGADLELELRAAVGDAAALDALLSWSDTLNRRARRTVGDEPAPGAAAGEADTEARPSIPAMQVERQDPDGSATARQQQPAPGDEAEPAADSQAPPATAPQPARPPVEAPPVADVPPADDEAAAPPPVGQPFENPDPDDEGDEDPATAPTSAPPTAGPTVVPPIGLPPIVNPTPTPPGPDGGSEERDTPGAGGTSPTPPPAPSEEP